MSVREGMFTHMPVREVGVKVVIANKANSLKCRQHRLGSGLDSQAVHVCFRETEPVSRLY